MRMMKRNWKTGVRLQAQRLPRLAKWRERQGACQMALTLPAKQISLTISRQATATGSLEIKRQKC